MQIYQINLRTGCWLNPCMTRIEKPMGVSEIVSETFIRGEFSSIYLPYGVDKFTLAMEQDAGTKLESMLPYSNVFIKFYVNLMEECMLTLWPLRISYSKVH